MKTRALACGVAAITSLASLTAQGQSMNPALERLVLDGGCRTAQGAFSGVCVRDDAAFKQLAGELAFALAPTGFHPARTVALGGFELAVEATFTKIDNSARYWQLGTRGPESNAETGSVVNNSPADFLSTWSLRARKGFGFGFEASAQFGFIPDTTILYGGGDVRWSLFEGFRRGAWQYIPDLAVGGGVRTTSGSSQITMTVVGLDAQLSKPIPIAENSILSPWIGYQYNWVFANSGLIDLTPATDALSYCNFQGRAQPGGPGALPNPLPDGVDAADVDPAYPGIPICDAGTDDFRNNVVFDEARLERQRLLVGMGYRYEMVTFGAQFITDIVAPGDAQAGSGAENSSQVPVLNADGTVATNADGTQQVQTVSDKDILGGIDSQWTIVLQAGVIF